MADLHTETLEIRKQLISAANIYKNQLAGKVFLYVYGDHYFEVAFMTECFKHLTGVDSPLRGNSFYDNAKNATLAESQIRFSRNHPLKKAKKKVLCLHQLPQLTKDLVCVVKDMTTLSLTYKLGITNLEFTIGLTENVDRAGNLVNDWLLPRTLRINDKAFENSSDAQFIDFIFSKGVTDPLYTDVCYSAQGVDLPKNILPLLCTGLVNSDPETDPDQELEDEFDRKAIQKAIIEHEKDPVSFSHEEVATILGL